MDKREPLALVAEQRSVSLRARSSAQNRNQFKPGQAIIEFALVLPLLVLFIVGIFDLGNGVFTRNMLENAAREGARAGVINGKKDAEIRTRVQAAAPTLNLSGGGQIEISPGEGSRKFNNPITVTVHYTYRPITPLIGQITGGGIQMTATSVMIVEGVIEIP